MQSHFSLVTFLPFIKRLVNMVPGSEICPLGTWSLKATL